MATKQVFETYPPRVFNARTLQMLKHVPVLSRTSSTHCHCTAVQWYPMLRGTLVCCHKVLGVRQIF
jgi:hypothetical protein